ncbi:3347_t:CDS:2, partial [Dentiscutata erythropus]
LTSLSVDVDIELFQNRCLAHIINLIVQNGIKKIKHIINKVRDCIKALHTSPKCRQAFIDACNYEDIGVMIPPLDCVTRWNSMFLMLDSAIKVKKALLRLKNRDYLFSDLPSEDE